MGRTTVDKSTYVCYSILVMRTEKTRLLRSGEVAKRLGLHPLTVRRWVKEGKITAIPIGREARIPITEVERLLGKQRAGVLSLSGRVMRPGEKDDFTPR